MVKRYIELFGFQITKKKIRNGLMVEIRAHEEAGSILPYGSTDEQKEQAKQSFNARMKAWETLFHCGGLGLHEDLFKIINPKTFHKEDQKLTSLILQLYSMETFLFDMIVKTAQNQDESKIKNLGPLACALRAILYGNTTSKDKVAFRGVLLTK